MFAIILSFFFAFAGPPPPANQDLTVTLQSPGGQPVIITVTSQYLKGYDWAKHEAVLTEQSVAKLKQFPVEYQNFTFYLKGKLIYTGVFGQPSDTKASQPWVQLEPNNTLTLMNGNRVKIMYNAKHSEVINNSTLKQYFAEQKLLL
ncbi:hypothetical protein BH09BAC1_BH09BAC1_19800 [soil metagenome]